MKQITFKSIRAVIVAVILGASGPFIYAAISDRSGTTDNQPDHSQHMQQLNQDAYLQKQASYTIPDTTLTDQNGRTVPLKQLFSGTEPLMVNFIFTSCNTVCPVQAATFSQVEKRYGKKLEGMKMISISIDPDYDTPTRLQEYAQRFRASDDWMFLTGDSDTVTEVLNAFDAYRGDKMNHVPLTLLRRAGDKNWLRVEGFPGGEDLYQLMSSSLNGQ